MKMCHIHQNWSLVVIAAISSEQVLLGLNIAEIGFLGAFLYYKGGRLLLCIP